MRAAFVFIKLPQMADLRAATGSLRREGGAKAQLVRIREQGQRLFGKAVGILGTAIMKQEPHSFQKPGWCPGQPMILRPLSDAACLLPWTTPSLS